MNYFSLLLVCLATTSLHAQTCDCPANLTRLRHLTETNYAGTADKLSPKTQPAYTRLLDSLGTAAGRVSREPDCAKILKRYVAFWRDPHLKFFAETSTEVPPGPPIVPDRVPLTEAEARQYLTTNRARLDPFEGIFEDDRYRLAVVRRPTKTIRDRFAAVVLRGPDSSWVPGTVKFYVEPYTSTRRRVRYLTSGRQWVEESGYLARNLLYIDQTALFTRTFPEIENSYALADAEEALNPIQLRVLDSTTVLFQLGSCGLAYKARVDSLVRTHAALLCRTSHLIIDVRGNGGGGTSTYAALLPYLQTGPIVQGGSRYWLSPDNVVGYRALLAGDQYLTPDARNWLEDKVRKGEAQPNSWYDDPADTLRLGEPLTHPRRVSVLSDRLTASSGEIFLLNARQSRKVTVFGERTAGVVDYGDAATHVLPCPRWSVEVPVRRSNYLDRVRYDNVGLAPQVPIPPTGRDWVAFVKKYRVLARR